MISQLTAAALSNDSSVVHYSHWGRGRARSTGRGKESDLGRQEAVIDRNESLETPDMPRTVDIVFWKGGFERSAIGPQIDWPVHQGVDESS